MKRAARALVLCPVLLVFTGCGLFDIYDCPVPVLRLVAPSDRTPERLRIINFNVLHGYPDFSDQEERYQNVLRAFRTLEADILILQEAWRTWIHGHLAERLAADLDMDMVYARANGYLPFLGFEEGSAILSRYPILAAERVLLLPRRPFWESRIALVATLALSPGRSLTIAGTHLTNRDPSVRRRQAEYLAKRLAATGRTVAIVAGDFNASSDSPVIDVFTGRGLVDAIPGGIDHILLDEESISDWCVAERGTTLRPKDMKALTGRAVEVSDHPALLLDLVRSPDVPAFVRAEARGDAERAR